MQARATLLLAWLALAAACGTNDASLVDENDGIGPQIRDPEKAPPEDAATFPGSPSSSSSSGAPSDGGGPDAPDAELPRCDPSWPLSAPQAVLGIPANAAAPTLTGDELRVYFSLVSSEVIRVFTAQRQSRAEPFAEPLDTGLEVFSPPFGHLHVTDDGMSLYFARYDADQVVRVYVARRENADAALGVPTVYREGAYADLSARDGSARLFSSIVGDVLRISVVRPANADPLLAQPIADGFLSWYEPSSGTLWFTQLIADPFSYVPMQMRWDGAAWSAPVAAERINHSSVDGCRLYGQDAAGNVTMWTRQAP